MCRLQTQHFRINNSSKPFDFLSPHHVTVLTLRGAIPVIELHALQGAVTGHTTETVGVEEFIHGSDCWLCAGQSLTTLPADL